MHPGFRDWAARALSSASLNAYLSGLRALESAYGDLDALHARGGFAALLRDLSYSAADERQGRPNPSRVAIAGNLARSLSNLRSHLRFYQGFKDGAVPDAAPDPDPEGEIRPAFERDLEQALRQALPQLEPGLRLADGGAQRVVPSGRIDILARDGHGRLVVIELKAVTARREAVAQVLAYMGDLAATEGGGIRGLLVAPGFDPRAIAAARMAPALALRRFTLRFAFDPVDSPAPIRHPGRETPRDACPN